jgi:tetratricopeptide (TPR) repeat protein
MFKARLAKRGREATIALYAFLLATLVAGSSPALAQVSTQDGSIQEKSIREELLPYRNVPAHPQSGRQAHQSLVVRQPAPDCELAGPEPNTVDADQWALLKLNYERHCYRQAEILIGERLRLLAAVRSPVDATTSISSRRRRLRTLKLLARAIADVPTVGSDVAVEDPASAASAVAPTMTDTVAETIPFDGVASSPPLKDAEFYCERGKEFYRNGDLAVALVDFDLAIRRDPNFEDAYIDRSITLYRMHALNRAFDDLAQAARIKNAQQNSTPLP